MELQALTKRDKIIVGFIFLLLVFLLAISGCSSEESNLKVALNIEFSVESHELGCLKDYVFIAVVDADDKMNWAEEFDCDHAGGSAQLDSGDLLELRCYGPSINKAIQYTYRITYGGETYEFIADYTGCSFLIP